MPKNVTSTTIARKLGISRATVSYVLNGQAEQRNISAATAENVMEMAQKLGYVPNELARSLRMRQSGVIGLVSRGLGYNWIERILVGMLPAFDSVGYTPFLSMSYWDAKREEREINSMLQRRVDAIICMPMPFNKALYQQIIKRGVPLVFLSDVLPDMQDVNYVLWDAGRATQVAMEHLIQTGRRRIGFIGADHQTVWTKKRFEVFLDCMKQADIPVVDKWIAWEFFDFSYYVEARIESMVDRIFSGPGKHPDALFVSSDALAISILDIFARMGIRVPEDVAMVGLGDLFMTDHAGISLSTVHEPIEELGKLAAETVIRLIEDPEQAPIQHIVAGEELIIRRSSNPATARSKR